MLRSLLAVVLVVSFFAQAVQAQGVGVVPSAPPDYAPRVLPTLGIQVPPGDPVPIQHVVDQMQTSVGGYQMLPYFQADAIIMHRSQGSFDFGGINWGVGPRFVLGRPIGDRSALEFGYFGIQGMNRSLFVADPVTADVGGVAGTAINNRVDYHSFMHNADFNYRYWVTPEFSVLAGFRYVNWHENVGSSFDPVNPFAGVILPPGSITQNYHTANNLYGLQLGADWKSMLTDRFGLDIGGKAGVFGNRSEFDANATIPGFGTITTHGHRSGTSFVSEIGIVATYRITDYLKFRVGYQMMWVEGLALAPDQIGSANLGGASTVSNRGGVFLHGAITGFELRW